MLRTIPSKDRCTLWNPDESRRCFLLHSVNTTKLYFLSAYYPRGVIRALPRESQIIGGVTPNRSFVREEDSEDEDEDDIGGDDVVRIESLEPGLQEMVQCASLNNMATLKRTDDNKAWEAHGDPTEIALQVFAHKAGHGKPHL